jgi:LysR family transcriptional regulator (chromosome initiation inhibitor)
MLDYSLLEAVEAVVETGSFHKAASKLRITQSAISQRVAHLEDQIGAPVIVRENPPKATRIGIQLIHHLREVRLKENELDLTSLDNNNTGWAQLVLGANADSAATWFFEALSSELIKRRIVVKLLVETDVYVHSLIERGEAQGCVMGRRKALPGCENIKLGSLKYTCVCTPMFRNTWFKKGFTKELALAAPSVLFDQHDTIQHQFLLKKFGIRNPIFPHHTVNSASGFLALLCSSCGYGMAPRMQIEGHLKRSELIELAPNCIIESELYWMYPRRSSSAFSALWTVLEVSAKNLLK